MRAGATARLSPWPRPLENYREEDPQRQCRRGSVAPRGIYQNSGRLLSRLVLTPDPLDLVTGFDAISGTKLHCEDLSVPDILIVELPPSAR